MMKGKSFLKAPLILMAAVGSQWSCKKAPSSKVVDADVVSVSKNKKVIVQCAIPQGNGGNWAATLGWLSEQMLVRAEQAEQLSTGGQQVSVFFGCMLGGSSGSIATNVVMRVLNNQALIPGARTDRLYTPAEARILGRAVRYIALAADLNLRELAHFFAQVAFNNATSVVNKARLPGLIMSVFGSHQQAKWWDGQQVDGKKMMIDFSTILHLAQKINLQMLEAHPEAFLKEEFAAAARQQGMNRVSDFPIFKNEKDVPRESADAKRLDSILDMQSKYIGEQSDHIIAKDFALGDYKARFSKNVYRGGHANYPLTRTLETPLSFGFCTITMARMYLNSAQLNLEHAPDYNTLRPLVFCSKETVQAILSSPLYRQHVRDAHPFARRYILATVKASRGSMSPSIREPGMMQELIGPANNGELEIEEIYAPDLDAGNGGKLEFQLMPTSGFNRTGQVIRPMFGIAGGFPDRRVSAWMMTYFYLQKVDEFKKNGFEVIGRLGVFGKPDDRSVDKFDTNVIRTIFSANPQVGESNVRDWYAWQDSYCNTFEPEVKRRGGVITTVSLNWDLTKIPAAQAGASRLIVVKGANAARSQLALYENATSTLGRFVFDPNITSDHVPRLSQGYPCRP
jgi:hypothetical protein